MTEYHVGAGLFGGIYAGRLNKNCNRWLNKTDCTDEALCAVRDYLKDKAETNKQNRFGYEWKLKDGRTVELMLTINGGTQDE